MRLRTILALFALASIARAQAPVSARAETTPVPNSGDAADDPAIWVHPTDPSLSVVIGTDKNEGLGVYSLSGQQLQFVSVGEPNNVDLRNGFRLGGQDVTLVTASDRSNNSMRLFVLDPSTRTLSNIAARTITFGIDIYGCCLYRSPVTGDFYFMGTSKSGGFEQWRLFDNGAGRVDATRVRTFDVGSDCEACVTDDELGFLFIAEETEGIWRYGAEPGAGASRISVDDTGGSNLTADVEGLSIYYASGGRGYLLASSQGSNTFAVYERQPPHAHVLNFEIVSGSGIDGVSDCDGIDVMNRSLGSAFADGLFVAQDGSNTGGNQNFKFLSWRDIASAASPSLIVDNTYVPQGIQTCQGQITRRGNGIPGSGGATPAISLSCPAAGQPGQIEVFNGTGGALGTLGLCTSPTFVRLRCTAFPQGVDTICAQSVFPHVLSAQGRFTLNYGPIPAALRNRTVYIQAGYMDPGAPCRGISLTEIVEATIR